MIQKQKELLFRRQTKKILTQTLSQIYEPQSARFQVRTSNEVKNQVTWPNLKRQT